MNAQRVRDFLAFGLSDHTAETMFADIFQLRGGECATVDASTSQPAFSVRRWASLDRPHQTIGIVEAAERLQSLLSDSIRLHVRSDVALGSCLSGGLDSSAIVCIMDLLRRTEHGVGKIRTVSACYEDPSVDERKYISEILAKTGADSNFVFLKPEDIFDEAVRITWHQDEPFGSTSIFAQWCVFKEARRVGLKVMLDGQGADELLAGYHTAFSYQLAHLLRSGNISGALAAVVDRSRLHGASSFRQLTNAGMHMMPAPMLGLLRRTRDHFVDHGWLEGDLARLAPDQRSASVLAEDALSLRHPKSLEHLCFSTAHATNLQMLLHWEDRNSMAHSVEARVPFLDDALADFCLALGNDHKIVKGETKHVLREAMVGFIPEAVRKRQDKIGFATPEQAWFRGPLREMMNQGVAETLALFPGLLNAKGVERRASDMLSGRRPVNFWLWRIVNFGIWARRFKVGS